MTPKSHIRYHNIAAESVLLWTESATMLNSRPDNGRQQKPGFAGTLVGGQS